MIYVHVKRIDINKLKWVILIIDVVSSDILMSIGGSTITQDQYQERLCKV
jgi:hypothetical protein